MVPESRTHCFSRSGVSEQGSFLKAGGRERWEGHSRQLEQPGPRASFRVSSWKPHLVESWFCFASFCSQASGMLCRQGSAPAHVCLQSSAPGAAGRSITHGRLRAPRSFSSTFRLLSELIRLLLRISCLPSHFSCSLAIIFHFNFIIFEKHFTPTTICYKENMVSHANNCFKNLSTEKNNGAGESDTDWKPRDTST